MSPTYLSAFRNRIDANLRFFDTLDGTTDWPVGPCEQHPLVDCSKPVSDGVNEPTVLATKTFPYLAAPNQHPPVPHPGVATGPDNP